MPKKGIELSPKAIEAIKHYLKRNKMTQEKLADQLQVTPKTLNNWLSKRSTIDKDKLDSLIRILGLGLEDLFADNIPNEYVFHEETVKAVWRVYRSGLADIGHRVYRKIGELFRKNVSFVLFPKRGFFQTFEHDIKKGKNYYFQFWIQTDEEITEATFIISFTIKHLIRVNYGEIIVKSDNIEVKQYYQPPNFQVKRPDKSLCSIKVVTWFDEMPHTFVVVGDSPFKIIEKGRISEDELKQADDIAFFPKHFFFHEES